MNHLVTSRLWEKIRCRQQTLKCSKMIWYSCYFWSSCLLKIASSGGHDDFNRFFKIFGHRVSNLHNSAKSIFLFPAVKFWVNPSTQTRILTKVPSSLPVYFLYNFLWNIKKTIIFFSERKDAFKSRFRKSNCNHKFGAFEIQSFIVSKLRHTTCQVTASQ